MGKRDIGQEILDSIREIRGKHRVIFVADFVNYVVNIDVPTGNTETKVTLANCQEPPVWNRIESEDE